MQTVDYPLALALEDVVPVVLTGLGLWVVVRWNARRVPGWLVPSLVGVLLVVAGGAAKAAWKLAIALTDGRVDLVLADRALFVLLAPGYVLVLLAVTTGRWRPGLAAAPAVLLVGAAAGASVDWDVTRLSLLAVAAVASVALSVVLAVRSHRAGLRLAAALFSFHAVLVVALGGLGRAADPSVAMQWVDQLTNTAAQAMFLVAALRLAVVDADDESAGAATAAATTRDAARGRP